MAKAQRPSVESLLFLVGRCIQSELGTAIAGSEVELTTKRDFKMDAWCIQMRVGRRYQAELKLCDSLLESTEDREAYVLWTAKELTRLTKRMIFEADPETTIEDFAFQIFEETGISIGGEW